MRNYILHVGAVAVVCGAFMAGSAAARSSYDGSWSVAFYTRSGTCEAVYRTGVMIQNGVIYPEASGINFNGRVSSNGAVRANVSAGGQSASGSGRLQGYSGSGVWRGLGSRGPCAGTWTAEHRR